MNRGILAALALLCVPAVAFAAPPVTVTGPDGTQAAVTANGVKVDTGGLSTYPADVASTGNTVNSATPNAAYTVTLANGQGTTGFVVTGLTASGATLTIEASDDAGANWATVNGVAPGTGNLFTTLTADQQFRVNTGGRTKVRLRVSSTGSGSITVSSNASTTNGVTALGTPLPPGNNLLGQISETPQTAGGLLGFILEPAASDNHTNIKNGAGQVYHIIAFNNSATVNYIRLYNAGTGINGCNSASNLVWEGHIPASTSDAGFSEPIPEGLAFAAGISICVTSGYGQTNTTNATASAISIDVLYK